MNRIFLLISIVVAVALAGCGQSLTPRESAERFFQQIAKGDFESAYGNTALAFQTRSSPAHFRAICRELGLADINPVFQWDHEYPAETELNGVILANEGSVPREDKSGQKFVEIKTSNPVPVRVKMTRESGAWRVLSVRSKERDYFTLIGKGIEIVPPVNREMPGQADLEALVRESVALFNDAIVQGNFARFFTQISGTWQSQATEGQFMRAFQPFIDAKVDLSSLKPMTPVFDAPPEINSNGVLILEGHYATTPQSVHFNFQFVYEYPLWKLRGLEIQLRD